MKTLFKNATILTMNSDKPFKGDLLVENKRISKIAKKIDADGIETVVNCKNAVLLPGFKNAHAHSAMTFLRGGGKDLNLHDWLFTYCFPREEKLVASDVYHASKVAFVEYIKGGITSSLEQYFFPLETAKAAEEIGFRVVLQGTYNPFTSKDDLVRLFGYYMQMKDSLTSYYIGFHAEYTLDDELLRNVIQAVKETRSPFFTHISETKSEVEECVKRHGVSPVKYFESLGLLENGGGGYHCNFFSDEDTEIFKKNGMSIITNPGSNKYLNSGICPVQKYVDEGLNVAIGTDGPASNYDLDMFMEMRLIKENNPNLSAFSILKMATSNGAKAMYLKSCDSLSVGNYADLILLESQDLKSGDIFSNIIEKGNKDLVKLTMINGKILYTEGAFFIGEKVSDIYKKCDEIRERIDKEVK